MVVVQVADQHEVDAVVVGWVVPLGHPSQEDHAGQQHGVGEHAEAAEVDEHGRVAEEGDGRKHGPSLPDDRGGRANARPESRGGRSLSGLAQYQCLAWKCCQAPHGEP